MRWVIFSHSPLVFPQIAKNWISRKSNQSSNDNRFFEICFKINFLSGLVWYDIISKIRSVSWYHRITEHCIINRLYLLSKVPPRISAWLALLAGELFKLLPTIDTYFQKLNYPTAHPVFISPATFNLMSNRFWRKIWFISVFWLKFKVTWSGSFEGRVDEWYAVETGWSSSILLESLNDQPLQLFKLCRRQKSPRKKDKKDHTVATLDPRRDLWINCERCKCRVFERLNFEWIE